MYNAWKTTEEQSRYCTTTLYLEDTVWRDIECMDTTCEDVCLTAKKTEKMETINCLM